MWKDTGQEKDEPGTIKQQSDTQTKVRKGENNV